MVISSKNQEEISICYFNAVAAKANVISTVRRRDEDGVDAHISADIDIDGMPFVAEANFQLKTVYSATSYGYDKNGNIYYDLKVKNYNDLVKKAAINRYLALLILPYDNEDWVVQDVNSLAIKNCMYFVSLKGKEPSTNKITERIYIPKTNIFDVEHLLSLLNDECNGD